MALKKGLGEGVRVLKMNEPFALSASVEDSSKENMQDRVGMNPLFFPLFMMHHYQRNLYDCTTLMMRSWFLLMR